ERVLLASLVAGPGEVVDRLVLVLRREPVVGEQPEHLVRVVAVLALEPLGRLAVQLPAVLGEDHPVRGLLRQLVVEAVLRLRPAGSRSGPNGRRGSPRRRSRARPSRSGSGRAPPGRTDFPRPARARGGPGLREGRLGRRASTAALAPRLPRAVGAPAPSSGGGIRAATAPGGA